MSPRVNIRRDSYMHLSRNFAWSLDLSDREFRVVLKTLRGDDLSDDEQSLVDKLVDALATNAARLERISTGKSRDPRDAGRGS